ncbi:MAG: ribose-5-phosphate isomerase RpiA [Anaerolineales bacterium]|nr:ribose-5-phosphate isomerase RpiA [Anaerolineales bacterium]MCW5856217.1 ribose-5-phosphate isomerase RpiA [Anaerolineales bacterium]
MSTDEYKRQAAEAAVALVQPGMRLGLGHGSTVRFALEALAAQLQASALSDIITVPASLQTQAECERLGIPLGNLNDYTQLDLTIDGADEVDGHYNLIKGGGGALLREKILAQNSQRLAIIVDEGKLSERVGSRFRLPLEVLPFGWERQAGFVVALGGVASLRVTAGGEPALSDQGNYLLDCDFGSITDPVALATALEARSGVLEHGLFLGLATDVFVAGAGGVRHLRADAFTSPS